MQLFKPLNLQALQVEQSVDRVRSKVEGHQWSIITTWQFTILGPLQLRFYLQIYLFALHLARKGPWLGM